MKVRCSSSLWWKWSNDSKREDN